ncbi:hypothetical protein OS493_021237 [Desmophyllum pertusum]|uniref:Uncharacterized protein n=1 Tax=Desmophyllum pertusum TaxID=174260 RepID=A0A9W9ZNG5_9CNID|nr:hypothetical protein OS493_021237 [Desmophyllum pertusum]
MTGSGPVAWAKILGYFDNMAARTSNSSYPSMSPVVSSSTHLPLTMDTSVENLTRRIFHKLGSHCSPHGRGVTSPAQMARIKKAFRKVLGRELKVIHRGEHEGRLALGQT